ncbi:MAG: hypothetical protein SGJ24_07425 [Chloroflexota bacterium]|nr:hypothetical protein [Chloroflexota bacterium]
MRGGSWNNSNTDNFRAANRDWVASDNQNNNIGFRCVLSRPAVSRTFKDVRAA